MAGKARPEPQKASFQLNLSALTFSAPFPTMHTKAHQPSLTSLLSTAGSPGARSFPLGLAVGAQAPRDASYFCVPSQPGAGRRRGASRKGAEQCFSG